jgi:hypothetical protein
MVTYVLLFIFLCGAAVFKGKLDAIADEGIKSEDWGNKYNFSRTKNFKHWWYLGLYKPRFPEKFPFSSTILVMFTDQWHTQQFFMLRCIFLSISIFVFNQLYLILIFSFIIFPFFFGTIFEISYVNNRKKIKTNKKNKKND